MKKKIARLASTSSRVCSPLSQTEVNLPADNKFTKVYAPPHSLASPPGSKVSADGAQWKEREKIKMRKAAEEDAQQQSTPVEPHSGTMCGSTLESEPAAMEVSLQHQSTNHAHAHAQKHTITHAAEGSENPLPGTVSRCFLYTARQHKQETGRLSCRSTASACEKRAAAARQEGVHELHSPVCVVETRPVQKTKKTTTLRSPLNRTLLLFRC